MSNDLISRSVLMQSLRNNVLVDVTPNLEQAVEEQPTAYDLDKVIDKINNIFKHHTATKIVQRLVVETIEAGVSN